MRLNSYAQGVALAADKRPAVLSDQEFSNMMQEFDSAGQWMLERLTSKRASANAAAPKQSSTDSSRSAADNHQAIDENRSSAQLHNRR